MSNQTNTNRTLLLEILVNNLPTHVVGINLDELIAESPEPTVFKITETGSWRVRIQNKPLNEAVKDQVDDTLQEVKRTDLASS